MLEAVLQTVCMGIVDVLTHFGRPRLRGVLCLQAAGQHVQAGCCTLLLSVQAVSHPCFSSPEHNTTSCSSPSTTRRRAACACVLQLGARLAAAAAAAVLALGPGCSPSQAVTSEQLLFLEAWRAVDRAYVDKSFNGQNWFKVCLHSNPVSLWPLQPQHILGHDLSCSFSCPLCSCLCLQLREGYLKNESMVKRPQTYNAIRKLLGSLDDPFTRFLEPSRLAALRRGTAGQQPAVFACRTIQQSSRSHACTYTSSRQPHARITATCDCHPTLHLEAVW